MSPPDDSSLPGAGADLAPWLRLHLATLYAPEAAGVLLERFGDPAALFARLDAGGARVPLPAEIPERLLERLRDARLRREAHGEIRACGETGVSLLLRHGPEWPQPLDGLPRMPAVLYRRGEPSPHDTRAVAMVGTRRPSPYGVRQARLFAGAAARHGITVVSGLARGIDVECHRAALAAGGRTIAVLGSGLGCVYPSEHRRLVETMVASGQGVVLSEFPLRAGPRRHHFPQRNRLLSGLGCALLVVEAGERSGSLLTVDWALAQDRAVFVIPGRIDEPEARGGLRLIQSGAHPVLDPAELVELVAALRGEHGMAVAAPAPRAADHATPWPGDDPLLARLLPLFRERDTWHPDALCARLAMAPGELLAGLTRLEARGILERAVGGGYVLCEAAFR
jgi:DNA processing protein